MEHLLDLAACFLIPLLGLIALSLFRVFSDDGVCVRNSEKVCRSKGWGTYGPPEEKPLKRKPVKRVRLP